MTDTLICVLLASIAKRWPPARIRTDPKSSSSSGAGSRGSTNSISLSCTVSASAPSQLAYRLSRTCLGGGLRLTAALSKCITICFRSSPSLIMRCLLPALLFGAAPCARAPDKSKQNARLRRTAGKAFPPQIMTKLSFQLPEASIAVEATEVQRLFEELDRLGARSTGQDYARMARRVGTAAHEPSVDAVELLDVAENEKVLRALEHLAARDELSPGLVSLWEGLARDVQPAPVSYRLHLLYFDGREERRDMTSL